MTEEHWFVRACFFAQKYCSFLAPDTKATQKKIKKYFSQEYMETLSFTGLQVEPRSVLSLAYMVALLSFIGMFFLDFAVVISYGFDITMIDPITLLLLGVVTIFLPVVLMNMIASYPKTYAQYMKIHSLGDIPEILSYLVMYLKLVPNLENSVKFAASESSTSLAQDLRKMLWDMEIRVYHGIDDALTNFASLWGRWSEYFKRSLHLIRSSIQERDETSRVITLNRSLDVALDGTRDMMNQFASKLHQPTMVIYSIGIMIPLSLVAMLPAAGLIGLKITIFQVFIMYDILLPLIIFFYTRKVLLSRPATFNPPQIPSYHPELIFINKKRRLLLSLGIGCGVSIPGVIFILLPVFFTDTGSLPPLLSYIVSPDGLNTIFPVTLFFIWGIAAFVTSYCLSVYRPYKKVRDDIKQIEREFGDALYILGKRIAEEKSPEESFVYTAHTMSGAKIAQVFSQTGYNLTAMHTNVRDALFSPEYGSLKHVYSDRVKAIMRLFVEGIQKSQRAVSISLIKIADHLKELQEVEKKIRESLYALTSTLRSTAALFAPLIAGVTLAITKLITNIIASMAGKIPSDTFDTGGSVLSTVSESFTLENVRPEFFVLVVGIYIIELVFLLTRFTNGIDEGDDKPAFMYSLGQTMPTAVIVLTMTVIIGQMLFSSIVRPVA
ncbi:MAG: hypothetical protein QXL17_04275 [Candidatus Thermoplasmatota archaeon]